MVCNSPFFQNFVLVRIHLFLYLVLRILPELLLYQEASLHLDQIFLGSIQVIVFLVPSLRQLLLEDLLFCNRRDRGELQPIRVQQQINRICKFKNFDCGTRQYQIKS